MATTTRPSPPPHGVFFDATRKRFHASGAARPYSMLVDASGLIKGISDEARTLLEYGPDDEVEPSFFSHIHGKNQYQVMRDVADMIVHGKHVATWFLRIRTGRRRWQWFRASAFNELGSRQAIGIRLKEATPEW